MVRTPISHPLQKASTFPLCLATGILLILSLPACAPATPAPPPLFPPLFIPPAPPTVPSKHSAPMPLATVTANAPTPSPTPSPNAPADSPPPTPTLSECINDLRYIDDLTFEDGTIVTPGQEIDKQWLVQNNGTCDWEEGYRLALIGGEPLGAPEEVALYPARAGAQAVLRIPFIAPSIAGRYLSAWQAFDPNGTPFGDTVYLDITVAP